MEKQNRLWYRQPARKWTEALPLGNGRIGAMVFGHPAAEMISLNEDSLWSGYPRDTNIPGAAAHFKKAQAMIAQGKNAETQRYIEDTMLGPYTESYLPLGDLLLDFGPLEAKEYSRRLSLDKALHTTCFTAGGVVHTREAFVSHPDQALLLRLEASAKGCVTFRMAFQTRLRGEAAARGNRLVLSGVAPSRVEPSYVEDPNPVRYEETDALRGMRFRAVAEVEAEGGVIRTEAGALFVEGADAVTIRLVARTSFNGFDRHPFTEGRDEAALCERDLGALAERPWAESLRAHIADHQGLFGRVSLDLAGGDYSGQPTDDRLMRFPEQPDDRALYSLIFQYGRYLIIAGSRPGSEPMNLQGIWNQHLRAPWSANYTININTQMNYWPAEAVALPELAAPLFDLAEGLRKNGAETARVHYGAGGAVSHHNADLWRLSSPVGNFGRGHAVFAFWPMSFGWLCQHLFEHYQFTRDREFLRARALPALRDAARFYLDTLARDAQGRYMMSPSTSPENTFYVGGERCAVAKGATMSNAIVREVFSNYLSTLEILGLKEDMTARVREILPDIYPFQIGSQGQLLEWDQEFEEAEPRHRHVSHLYGLHPGRQITLEETPELAEACRKTLALRGDEGTGWSLGWKVNFHARLRDGDHALRLIQRQMRYVESDDGTNYSMSGSGTLINLFTTHPPFQIDGNFGACSGIAEMLIQSNGEEVRLLPALPGEWETGSVRGLRAHGGLCVDIGFAEGKMTRATVTRIADCDGETVVLCQGKRWRIAPGPGETVTLEG